MPDEGVIFVCAVIVLTLTALVYLYRVAVGPTLYDRVLGLGGVGTKTVVILVLIGAIYRRVDMFVDIAIGFALLHFIGTLAAADYLRRYEHVRDEPVRDEERATPEEDPWSS